DELLFRGLAFAQLQKLGASQEQGFAALAEALAQHGGRLESLLDEVREVVVETHINVLEIKSELQQQGQRLGRISHRVPQTIEQQQGEHRRATLGDAKPDRSEEDIRLELMNTLLQTPHRDLGKIWPIHEAMAQKDPNFYVHLAAWYDEHGEVRDHKEMFMV